MKLLFFTSGLKNEYGGTAISESSLIQELSQKIDLEVVCSIKKWDSSFVEKLSLPMIHLYSAKEIFFCFLFQSGKIHSLLQSTALVHFNGYWNWEHLFIGMVCRKKNIPYIVHPRGMCWIGSRKVFLKKMFHSLLGRKFLQKAKRVIVLSRFEARNFSSLGISEKKWQVIPNGVYDSTLVHKNSVLEFSSVSSVSSALATHSYFLYFGRIERRKNLEFLIESYQRYISLGGSVSLLLIGPVEREYDTILNKKIKQANLEEKIQILNPIYGEKKWKYLQKAKAVVYPSIEEAFGRVPFEALLVNTPVILPKESGGAEYLSIFLENLFYEQNKIESLASIFLTLQENGVNPQNLERAKLWVEEELHWKKITNRVILLYNSVSSISTQLPGIHSRRKKTLQNAYSTLPNIQHQNIPASKELG